MAIIRKMESKIDVSRYLSRRHRHCPSPVKEAYYRPLHNPSYEGVVLHSKIRFKEC